MDVLLVEDSDVVQREIERALLNSVTVEAVVTVDGIAEARTRLEERDFDLWVLDFELDDGTAMDLLGDLDAVEDSKRPIVAVITAYASTLLGQRCLEAGADAFFWKAEGLDELLALVEEEGSRAGAG